MSADPRVIRAPPPATAKEAVKEWRRNRLIPYDRACVTRLLRGDGNVYKEMIYDYVLRDGARRAQGGAGAAGGPGGSGGDGLVDDTSLSATSRSTKLKQLLIKLPYFDGEPPIPGSIEYAQQRAQAIAAKAVEELELDDSEESQQAREAAWAAAIARTKAIRAGGFQPGKTAANLGEEEQGDAGDEEGIDPHGHLVIPSTRKHGWRRMRLFKTVQGGTDDAEEMDMTPQDVDAMFAVEVEEERPVVVPVDPDDIAGFVHNEAPYVAPDWFEVPDQKPRRAPQEPRVLPVTDDYTLGHYEASFQNVNAPFDVQARLDALDEQRVQARKKHAELLQAHSADTVPGGLYVNVDPDMLKLPEIVTQGSWKRVKARPKLELMSTKDGRQARNALARMTLQMQALQNELSHYKDIEMKRQEQLSAAERAAAEAEAERLRRLAQERLRAEEEKQRREAELEAERRRKALEREEAAEAKRRAAEEAVRRKHAERERARKAEEDRKRRIKQEEEEREKRAAEEREAHLKAIVEEQERAEREQEQLKANQREFEREQRRLAMIQAGADEAELERVRLEEEAEEKRKADEEREKEEAKRRDMDEEAEKDRRYAELMEKQKQRMTEIAAKRAEEIARAKEEAENEKDKKKEARDKEKAKRARQKEKEKEKRRAEREEKRKAKEARKAEAEARAKKAPPGARLTASEIEDAQKSLGVDMSNVFVALKWRVTNLAPLALGKKPNTYVQLLRERGHIYEHVADTVVAANTCNPAFPIMIFSMVELCSADINKQLMFRLWHGDAIGSDANKALDKRVIGEMTASLRSIEAGITHDSDAASSYDVFDTIKDKNDTEATIHFAHVKRYIDVTRAFTEKGVKLTDDHGDMVMKLECEVAQGDMDKKKKLIPKNVHPYLEVYGSCPEALLESEAKKYRELNFAEGDGDDAADDEGPAARPVSRGGKLVVPGLVVQRGSVMSGGLTEGSGPAPGHVWVRRIKSEICHEAGDSLPFRAFSMPLRALWMDKPKPSAPVLIKVMGAASVGADQLLGEVQTTVRKLLTVKDGAKPVFKVMMTGKGGKKGPAVEVMAKLRINAGAAYTPLRHSDDADEDLLQFMSTRGGGYNKEKAKRDRKEMVKKRGLSTMSSKGSSKKKASGTKKKKKKKKEYLAADDDDDADDSTDLEDTPDEDEDDKQQEEEEESSEEEKEFVISSTGVREASRYEVRQKNKALSFLDMGAFGAGPPTPGGGAEAKQDARQSTVERVVQDKRAALHFLTPESIENNALLNAMQQQKDAEAASDEPKKKGRFSRLSARFSRKRGESASVEAPRDSNASDAMLGGRESTSSSRSGTGSRSGTSSLSRARGSVMLVEMLTIHCNAVGLSTPRKMGKKPTPTLVVSVPKWNNAAPSDETHNGWREVFRSQPHDASLSPAWEATMLVAAVKKEMPQSFVARSRDENHIPLLFEIYDGRTYMAQAELTLERVNTELTTRRASKVTSFVVAQFPLVCKFKKDKQGNLQNAGTLTITDFSTSYTHPGALNSVAATAATDAAASAANMIF